MIRTGHPASSEMLLLHRCGWVLYRETCCLEQCFWRSKVSWMNDGCDELATVLLSRHKAYSCCVLLRERSACLCTGYIKVGTARSNKKRRQRHYMEYKQWSINFVDDPTLSRARCSAFLFTNVVQSTHSNFMAATIQLRISVISRKVVEIMGITWTR